ncbi:hypothetical protein ACN91_21565 [Bacillus cereus]|uniref:hypothetical protein n=1 Tax=Bacillus TaxID=1386 RepID=UPI0006AD6509|nr:hypothetical protein [Bacillus cereus]ALC54072.1 hypothetical protein ACN91_21565 [Bacillus cereus]MEB9439696.1 hypothetical protein [Bacillus cereus]QPW49745.1 hypothetical protein G9298_18975 [Bacillus thuringiensis]
MTIFPNQTPKEKVQAWLNMENYFHMDYKTYILEVGLAMKLPLKIIIAYLETNYLDLQHLDDKAFILKVNKDMEELKGLV